MNSLAEALERVKSMTPEDKAKLDGMLRGPGAPVWVPQAGPQRSAYNTPADIVFYGGAAGGGKGLALDTPLPTPAGWVLMADVKPGDTLFDQAGQPCTVTAVSEISRRPCFQLVFDDGAVIVADDVHRWVTFNAAELAALTRTSAQWRQARREKRPSRATGTKSAAFTAAIVVRNQARAAAMTGRTPTGTMRNTAEIAATLRTASGRANHAIPVAGSLCLPVSALPIPPYTLGAWLGDGTSASGAITSIDPEVWQRVEADGFEVRHSTRDPLYHGVIGLKALLRANGMLRNKHIPTSYLRASEDDRLNLLRGLMDTDGHAALDGGSEFDTTSERLALGVLELALSLGIKATITEGVAKLDGRVIGPKWRVKFTTNLQVFALPRKAARIKPEVRRVSRFRYIVDCQPVESVPTRCISVDSPTRQYLAGRAMVPTHNTELILGLCLVEQQHSIIFRREAVQLVGIEERMFQILGTRKGYNSQDGVWRLPGGRVMELGSVKEPGDWIKYQGRPHDGIFFDEICHFTELQFRTLNGWLRTDKPEVRQRVVAAGNPPTTAEGEWVKRYWAPWLDPQHPRPAKPGELRWYISDAKGEDLEVDGSEAVVVPWDKDPVKPKSRTFIPSSVDDNLFLLSTGYKAQLQSLPEPLRSQMLRGDFQAGASDPAWQLIPTEWVKAAMARWKPRTTKGEMTCLGLDPSRGGQDKTSAAPRYGNWFDTLVTAPGVVTKDGPTAAAFAAPLLRNGAPVAVDAIGIGSSALDFLKGLGLLVYSVVGSEASTMMDSSGQMRMRNRRAEMYWAMREALDPTNAEPIELPPDPELLADLCAVRYKVVTMGRVAAIQIRDKDEIREALGRSPDKGDSVAMTFCTGIPKVHKGRVEKSWRDRLKNTSRQNGSAQAA